MEKETILCARCFLWPDMNQQNTEHTKNQAMYEVLKYFNYIWIIMEGICKAPPWEYILLV